MAVHDALGTPGGTRGEQHPQRVVEGGRGHLQAGRCADRVRPRQQVAGTGQPEVRHVHGGPQRGQMLAQLGYLGPPVDFAPVPAVPVRSDQHYRVELGEPGRGAGRRVVLGAGRPHGADAGAGQEGHQRLGGVGQVADDPVPGPDAEAAQRGRERAGLGPQLRPGQGGGDAPLVDRGDRDGVGPGGRQRMAQRVAGVVDLRPREPHRPGHPVVSHYGAGARGQLPEVVEVGHRAPEPVQVPDRPLPQRTVGTQVEPRPLPGEGGEPGDGGPGDALRGGGPDRVGRRSHRGEWAPVIRAARSSGARNDGGGGGPQLYSPRGPSHTPGFHSASSTMQSRSE